MVEADPRGRFFAWKRSHPVEAEDDAAIWEAAWKAGGAAQLHLDAQLARELGQVHAMLERTERLINLLAEREVEESSPYWHSGVGS